MKLMEYKKAINILSYIVVVLSFYYIIDSLSGYKLGNVFEKSILITLVYLILFAFIKSAFVFINGYIFRMIVEFTDGKKVNLFTLIDLYVKSNITKYIPSNVIPYVTRVYLGDKIGLGKLNITMSSFLEIFLGISNTAIIIIISLIIGLAQLPQDISFSVNYQKIFFVIIISLVVVFLIASSYFISLYLKNDFSKSKIKTDLRKVIKKYFNQKFFLLYIKIFLLSVLSFVLIGMIFYMMAYLVLNYKFQITDFFNISICLGIAGYSAILTPGVPGGIGVKETVSVVLISLYGYQKAPLVLAVIFSRIILILADVISYLLVLGYNKYRIKGTEN